MCYVFRRFCFQVQHEIHTSTIVKSAYRYFMGHTGQFHTIWSIIDDYPYLGMEMPKNDWVIAPPKHGYVVVE